MGRVGSPMMPATTTRTATLGQKANDKTQILSAQELAKGVVIPPVRKRKRRFVLLCSAIHDNNANTDNIIHTGCSAS